ncbi:PREDICTED: receptor-like protein kinase 5 [Theobroma cacao]|uniref:Receptor-like protein kinase 5 n=1 Tax=Theobroma cacao TaxID=3641 RepID=A0AB32WX08_THECC|nr:PREDICTED: receptor-like protein kinase 5 [Theobroma cacao]
MSTLSAPAFPSFYLKFLLLALFLTHVSPQLHDESEQALLLKLKTYWQNPPSFNHWAPSSNSSSHCSWPEITCLNDSVTGLTLANKGINEAIPPFICDLKNLTSIDLNYNNLVGEFPKTLYNCSKLEYLDLSQNYFVGTIPDDIDSLGQLQSLNLMGNNFSGQIPVAIGRLQDLRSLLLCSNQFNGSFPPEIGNLSKLEFLGLAYNTKFQPSNLPPTFKQLKKLKTLWMTEASLVGEIPDMIGDMTALEVLDLSSNNLTGNIPSALFLLKNLEGVYLFHSKLSGEIPQVIKASNLRVIDLSQNNLTGRIPSDIGKLENLSGLVLFFNQLSGEIPESIGRISTLTDVRLFSNNLWGTLPPDFGRYSMLEYFEVASNRLTGRLPEHLCHGGKLLGLVAFDNNLAGELPKSLGNCNSLIMVNIRNNGLTGSIPSGLWTSLNLSMLMISDNFFTGELPKKVSHNLSRLEISNNKFFGQIPVEVNSWRSLVVFKASNNLFNSTIPKALTALPFLTTLLLDQNQLHGFLPSPIISWRSLVTLNLGQNQLSGQIPEDICVLPSLLELDLSKNQFSGQIPPKLGLLRLTSLNLSSNLLIGNIPKQFENAAYSNSFLHNPGLCASSPYINLENCSSPKKSSIRALQNPTRICGIVIGIFVFISACSFFMIKYNRKREHVLDPELKLTFYQNFNFTESDVLSRLIEENKIGSGGSGNVYRVELTCSDNVNKHANVVAAKVIRNNRKSEHLLEKQFRAEVEILGKIRHLNIVKLICCISSETSNVLVYEYLENRSLDIWLHKHRATTLSCSTHNFILDWPKRLQIAIQAAQGLCYMHHYCSAPIIHRDVKSSNILLDSEFNAKIADFGLAKMSIKRGEEPITVSGVAGSVGYIAPEYARTTRIDEKIDVYSFGVILLELTTGREAHNGDKNRSLAEWAQHYFQDNNSIVDALDEEIKEACYLDQMCNVFKVGIHCTRTSPSRRPCMRKVLQMLQKSSHSRIIEDKNENRWDNNGVDSV